LCEAQTRPWCTTENLSSMRSINLPPASAIKPSMLSFEQNDEKNVHLKESKLSDENQQILEIDAMKLAVPRHSMNCLSQELEAFTKSKMKSHIQTLHLIRTIDWMNISDETRLLLNWQNQHNLLLQNSHSYHLDLCTPFLKSHAYPDALKRVIFPFSVPRSLMERQRPLIIPANIQHPRILSNELPLDGAASPHKAYALSGFFPAKLHRLLLDLDQRRGGGNIAHFVPNGKAFVILDPHRFEREVMKGYFPRMSSYASFQRQLNLYDFRRIPYGSGGSAYYHPFFLRECPSMSIEMKRIKEKRKHQDTNSINLGFET
jgi:hypothetical protein